MKIQDSSVKLAFEFARSQTRHHSKSFYVSTCLLPREKRWDTFALYNFCRYADNIIDTPRMRSVDELKKEIDNLALEIESAYKYGESEHPVLKSFIVVALKYEIPIRYPLELLEGVKMDLEITRYATFNDLYTFCYKVAGVVGIMMTHVIGSHSKKVLHYAEHLGIAMQLTNILRDLKEDKDMDRIYIPEDELSKFNLSYDDIKKEMFDDRMKQLIQFQTQRANEYYQNSREGIQLLTPNARIAISSASKIYQSILVKLQAQNYNPFLGRVFVQHSEKMKILFTEFLRTRLVIPGTRSF